MEKDKEIIQLIKSLLDDISNVQYKIDILKRLVKTMDENNNQNQED